MFQAMKKLVNYYTYNYNYCIFAYTHNQMRKFGEEAGFAGSFIKNEYAQANSAYSSI